MQEREASSRRASIVDRMIGAAKLRVSTFEDVEADRSATRQAMLVVIAVAIATGIGSVGGGVTRSTRAGPRRCSRRSSPPPTSTATVASSLSSGRGPHPVHLEHPGEAGGPYFDEEFEAPHLHHEHGCAVRARSTGSLGHQSELGGEITASTMRSS